MEAAPPCTSPAPFLSLPGDSLAAPSGTWGQLEDSATHLVQGCGSLGLVPSAQFSLPDYFGQIYLETMVEAAYFKMTPFLFFLKFFSCQDPDFVNKFTSLFALPTQLWGYPATDQSLSMVIAACPDAHDELFADKLQTCSDSEKLFSK